MLENDGSIKPKKYKLIIVKKDTEDQDIIGEGEINIAEYGNNVYQNLVLPLSNCQIDEKAYLEVALRGRPKDHSP